jgi:prepilin-type N-terminal cleavage/methylation domain-containing protein/prepilin-type processing-associated H-X9-DG protein
MIRTRRRDGFTLIEILVVIAVIAILAALLFPVFAQAREKARQTVCLSNMRQMSSALQMYTQDYSETLPIHEADADPFMREKVPANWAKDLYPYVKNIRVYVCPTARTTGAAKGLETTSLLGNGVLLRPAGVPLAIVPSPADIIAFQEGQSSFTTAYNRPYFAGGDKFAAWHYLYSLTGSRGGPFEEGYSNQHMNGGNLVFADGHARWRRYASIRSGEFGLLPDEPNNADSNFLKPYTGAF